MIFAASHRTSLISGLALFSGLLFTQTTPAQVSAPLATGKWVGTFDTVNADGSVDPGQAYLLLTQNGSQLAGTAGDSASHQSPITSGTVSSHHLLFTVAVNSLTKVNFDLQQQGDRLLGTANGLPTDQGATIRLHAVRADDKWQTAAMVPHEPDGLYAVVAELDKRLFDAYNTCDLKTLGALVSEDLEFYHDKTGLAVGRDTFLNAIQSNICGKTQRTLTPGSLEVHRLAHYGAVETGAHTFSHPGLDTDQGQAKFVTIWHFKDGSWQMTRAISYDHEPLKH